ncbi:MAG: SDR family NAD(P)-dependent oxidoreductase [Gemmatimonadota bacterium]
MVEEQKDRRVALVTGSTDGLGAEVARRLGARGWHVLLHGRDRRRGESLARDIDAGPGGATFYEADFAALSQVRHLADEILRDCDRLNVLVNNAGILLRGDERRESDDGYELHFAVNHLAHFLLTRLILPLLERSAPARIINVASGAQQALDFDDLMLERGYTGGSGYARSKLAQVLFTIDLAQELEGTGIDVVALHPATLMDTRMVREAGYRPRSSVDEGADAVMRLVTDDVESGEYFDGQVAARAHEQAYDEEARGRLRRVSEELTGAGG